MIWAWIREGLSIQVRPPGFLLGPGRGDHYAYMALGTLPIAAVFCVWLVLMGLGWIEASRGYVAARIFLPRFALFPLAHGLIITAELTGRFGTLGIAARVAAGLLVAFIIGEAVRVSVVYRGQRVQRENQDMGPVE